MQRGADVLKNKDGGFGLIPLLALLFGSMLIVSAVVLNSTDNYSGDVTLNATLINTSFNNELRGANETANLTNPLESVTIETGNISTINQTVENLTITNESLPKKQKNLSQTIEKQKGKLNNETEKYLKEIKNKKEEGKYIVKFRNSIDENKLINVTLEKKLEKFKVTKIKGKAEDVEDLIEDNEVEFLELDQDVKVLDENVPFNIKKVKADSVWNLNNGSGVKVAVLDTGIGLHNDLSIAGGVSLVDNNYLDSNGHGTSVAGVIAALLNNNGLVGVAPSVDLYSIKIMQSSTGDLSNAIAGIEWAINNSMDIVSMSFGFNSYSQIFKEVLQEAYNNNILLVAASGNEGTDNILYPAKYDTVIAVGATTIDNNLAYFSSYGFEQELVAHGVDINSTYLGNSYSISSGTSLAAPHVAGVAALIKAYNKSLTNEQIRAKLRNDALDLGSIGKDDLFGYGLVQINLQSSNFTIINLSYFYEVFNITNFRLPNESFVSWLNGNGTIDEVNFTKGLYLVNITFINGSKKSNIYNVSENGSIFVLGTTIEHDDNYIYDGSSHTDGIAWVNDGLTVKVASTTVPTPEGECYWVDGGGGGNQFNYCFFDTTTHKNECDSDPDITCGGATNCQIDTLISQQRSIINYASARSGSSRARVYDDCTTPGSGIENSETLNYYVIDTKRWRCTGSLSYVAEGWYGTNWVTIDTDSCPTGKVCVDSANITTETYSVDPCQNPPANQTCSGTIASFVSDSKNNPLNGTKVYNDGAFNGFTDSDGYESFNITTVCGNAQNITIKCADNTFCDSKFTSIDSAGDYDSLSFTCNICVNKTDLSISTKDVTIKSQGNKFNITVLINVEKVNQNNVKVDFRGQSAKDGSITQNETKTISVSQYVNQNVSVLWDLNKTDFVSITVDFSNIVAETDESNNYIRKATRPLTKAYVDVSTDYPVLIDSVKNYLSQYIDVVSQGSQEINIYIGRKNSNIPKGLQTTDRRNWKFENNIITFTTKSEGLPYNGLAVKQNNNIYIIGNEIDGELAALRKIVDNQEFYFSKSVSERIDYISEEDLDGLFVFDYLHTDENQAKYRKNSANFGKVVENVLNSDVSTLAIKRVLTANDNTSLRLKNINAELSPKFRNFSNSRPVVLGAGLFQNLFRLENFGKKLVTDDAFNGRFVRDVWLIEPTGGPNTECISCPNYNYTTLIDYYWPASVGGVMKYSNTQSIDFIGASFGAGLALKSYEKYYQGTSNVMGYYLNSSGEWNAFNLSPNFVEQMIAIVPMGAFNGTTRFTAVIDRHGEQAENSLSSYQHINQVNISKKLSSFCSWFELDCLVMKYIATDENYISHNLFRDLNNIVINKSDGNPHLSNINRLLVVTARLGGFNDDFVVPDEDPKSIYKNSNANKKFSARIPSFHILTTEWPGTYFLVSSFINNQSYSDFDKKVFSIDES